MNYSIPALCEDTLTRADAAALVHFAVPVTSAIPSLNIPPVVNIEKFSHQWYPLQAHYKTRYCRVTLDPT